MENLFTYGLQLINHEKLSNIVTYEHHIVADGKGSDSIAMGGQTQGVGSDWKEICQTQSR
ncbi:hypothetical protein MAR_008270 [Mya arenaria]|uniref:Uncharacterized protein n=1 Tax=Mya arenaria TaxID=6604 RepID=A0ABY7DY51_MYAAR|nr:hypothetical protein MAR_008270 [Mya arenaria]